MYIFLKWFFKVWVFSRHINRFREKHIQTINQTNKQTKTKIQQKQKQKSNKNKNKNKNKKKKKIKKVLKKTNYLIVMYSLFENHFIDAEPPVIFGIPSSQNLISDPYLATANVSWTLPKTADNSGQTVTLTSDYSPGDNFPIGNTTVTYTAVDVYGNTANYSFDVVVRGKMGYDYRKGTLYVKEAVGIFPTGDVLLV